jgi:predicted O-methyltransferase YrrM
VINPRLFDNAEQYSRWNPWMLSREAISAACGIIASAGTGSIVEFGSGYSTIVINDFLRSINSAASLISFEHRKASMREVMKHIAPRWGTAYRLRQLVQFSDQLSQLIFCGHANVELLTVGHAPIVPVEDHDRTDLKNAFYFIDCEADLPGTIDLVILDGPNGNGRSIAFPLLRGRMRRGSHILIDDVEDHPFIEQMGRVFDYQMIRHCTTGAKEWALVQINGVKSIG